MSPEVSRPLGYFASKPNRKVEEGKVSGEVARKLPHILLKCSEFAETLRPRPRTLCNERRWRVDKKHAKRGLRKAASTPFNP